MKPVKPGQPEWPELFQELAEGTRLPLDMATHGTILKEIWRAGDQVSIKLQYCSHLIVCAVQVTELAVSRSYHHSWMHGQHKAWLVVPVQCSVSFNLEGGVTFFSLQPMVRHSALAPCLCRRQNVLQPATRWGATSWHQVWI